MGSYAHIRCGSGRFCPSSWYHWKWIGICYCSKKRSRKQGRNLRSSIACYLPGRGTLTPNFLAPEATARGRWYNFLHSDLSGKAKAFDRFINILILLTAFAFMFDTLSDLPPLVHIILDSFELICVSVFTMEYIFRVYAVVEDPKYSKGGGRLRYMQTLLAGVDFLSVAPYWIEVCLTGKAITPISDSSYNLSNAVKALRLLRILRFERYTHGR